MLYWGCSNWGGSRPIVRAIRTASVICWADHSTCPRRWQARRDGVLPDHRLGGGVRSGLAEYQVDVVHLQTVEGGVEALHDVLGTGPSR